MASANLGRVGIVPKGDWNSATQYEKLDLVTDSGNSWLAKRANKNVAPNSTNTDDWQLISNSAAQIAAIDNVKAAIADTFSAQVLWNAGDFVWYEHGELYTFTADHSGAWTGTDVIQIPLSDELMTFERNTAARLQTLTDRVTAAEQALMSVSIVNTEGPNNPVSFADGSNNGPVKATVSIPLTQTGSGTPSLTNIRPIVAADTVAVTVSATEGGAGTTTSVDLGYTVAAGTLVINRDGTADLTITHNFAVLDGTENWSLQSGANGNPNFLRATSDGNGNRYPVVSSPASSKFSGSQTVQPTSNNSNVGMYVYMSGSNTYPYVVARLSDMSGVTADSWKETLAALKTADTPMTMAYKLATARTFSLDVNQVKTLLGQNYVATSIGTITVEYCADPKLYIAEAIANA